jgi:hypothetical protein
MQERELPFCYVTIFGYDLCCGVMLLAIIDLAILV